MVSGLEPFFTFRARIPPAALADLTVQQIIAHVDYWTQMSGGDGGREA